MLNLSAYGFVTEDEALASFRRDGTSTDPTRELSAIERALNAARGWMESYSGRRLACRTYRDAVTLTALSAADAGKTVTGTGFTAGVYAGDAVIGTGMQAGTVVESVESNTSLTISKPVTAAISSGSLTFGSERLTLDGDFDDPHEIWIPETPVKSVISAAWLDGNGNEATFDTTGARLDKDNGRYVIPNDTIPRAAAAILVACRAGYVRPSGTDRGDAEWDTLARLQLRVAGIFFDDERRNPGRALSRQLVQIGSSIPGFKMPDDVLEGMAPFRVRG